MERVEKEKVMVRCYFMDSLTWETFEAEVGDTQNESIKKAGFDPGERVSIEQLDKNGKWRQI